MDLGGEYRAQEPEVQQKGSVREELRMQSFASKVKTTVRAAVLDSWTSRQPMLKALTTVYTCPCAHTRESKIFSKNLIYSFKHQSNILGKIKTWLDFLTCILWVSIVSNFNYIWPVGDRGCADCSELKASKGLKTQPWWPLKSLSLSFGA